MSLPGREPGGPSPRALYLQVCADGDGRVRILGATPGSRIAAPLLLWLSGRPEVLRVQQRKETGVIQVHYREGSRLPGRFLRAVRERLSVLRGDRLSGFAIAPVHASAGRLRLAVRGLDAQQLVRLTAFAAALPGVKQADPSADSATILLQYDAREVSAQRLLAALRRSELLQWPPAGQEQKRVRWGNAALGSAVLLSCLTRAAPFPVLACGVVFNMLRPLRRSLKSVASGRLSIDLLDVVATTAALLTRQPTTAAFIIWMVGVGDLLLDISTDKARAALSRLMQLEEPAAFRILPGGGTERVAVDQLEAGDHLVVEGGHAIAADGKVIGGAAVVDEKVLTGESQLIAKSSGAGVLAATVVVEGQLIVEVERSGRNTEAAKIVRILESARSKPLTLQRQALEVAGRLVSPTFGVAGAAALLSADINRAVCVVITDFGTGIRIAVPTSALTAMTVAARQGVLIKGAQYMERLSRADTILFDKTGTLTLGEPELVEVLTTKGVTEAELIVLCAAAEARHEHPVARALRAYAEKHRYANLSTELGSEEYVVGQGLSARVQGRQLLVGNAAWMQSNGLDVSRFRHELRRFQQERISALFVAIEGSVAGLVGYSDAIRPESSAIVRKLKAKGRRKVVLLSGDARSTVESVARAVDADEAIGALLPADKAEYVRRLRAAGHVVAMVGDGINDAPALALADVGISIAGSTEVALEVADVILLEGGLLQLAEAFAVSDRAMASVRRSLEIIIAPNATAIGLGALGLIAPPIAAVINNGATIAAVLAGTAPLLTTPVRHAWTREQREQAVRRQISNTSLTAAMVGAALSPLPGADEAALFFLHAELVRRIGHCHGLLLHQLPLGTLLRTIVNGLLARAVVTLPAAWIPGMAAVASATTAALLTELLGPHIDAACRHPEQTRVLRIKDFAGELRRVVAIARAVQRSRSSRRADSPAPRPRRRRDTPSPARSPTAAARR